MEERRRKTAAIDGGAPARVKAGNYEVTADAVVVATNTPINDLVAIHTKQAPYMSYVIGARVPRVYSMAEIEKLLTVGTEGNLRRATWRRRARATRTVLGGR